jgi:hypothetical protein
MGEKADMQKEVNSRVQEAGRERQGSGGRVQGSGTAHETVIPAQAGILSSVMPAKAGIHVRSGKMDSRLRGNDCTPRQYLNPEPCLLNPAVHPPSPR